MQKVALILWAMVCSLLMAGDAGKPNDAHAKNPFRNPGVYIDNNFENGSPFRWDLRDGDVIEIQPFHDHERFKPNQQWTHLNFKILATKEKIGSTITFKLGRIENVWNGIRTPAIGKDAPSPVVSTDGKTWTSITAETFAEGPFMLEFKVKLDAACTQVARVVPYTDKDLQQTLARIRAHPEVRIAIIGATVDGRPLEMVELGNPNAANQVFLRGRAHPSTLR